MRNAELFNYGRKRLSEFRIPNSAFLIASPRQSHARNDKGLCFNKLRGKRKKMDSCCTPIKHAKIKKNQGKNKKIVTIFQQNNQLQ